MSYAKFINNCESFKKFVLKTSKLPSKGNWRKGRLAKDTIFEFLTKIIIEKHPLFKKLDIDKIWHESEIPLREKKIINYPEKLGDVGFDLLIKTKNNDYHAVQSKFRSDPKDTLRIEKGSELATTFNLAYVKCKNIKNTYIFATINSLPKKSELIPKNCIFILNSFFRELDNKSSGFKWKSLKQSFKTKNFKGERKDPDLFQRTAVNELKKYFRNNSRGCLFLPCGTGKTLISYWFSKEMKYKKILILVPNLTLVSQILNNWVNQNNANKIENKWLAVCSDKDVRVKEDPLVINTKDLPFDSTTDNDKIREFLIDNNKKNIFIISTYNSSHKICDISRKIKFKFDLCIFDEAHKTVGTKDKLFAKALYEKNIKIKKRLFMTATKRQLQGHKDIIDMNDTSIYGKVAHEVSFKEAIEGNNKRLCNYKFKALGISKEEIFELWNSNPQVRSKNLNSTTMKYLSSLILLFQTWNKYKLNKGISFHNSIGASEDFKNIGEQYQKFLNKKNDVQFFNISSKKELTGDKQSIISDFENDRKSIITNARCLVEGVDVPAVDVVLFADKKRSRVDIVQAIGRCLRKSPETGKKFGYVVVPFVFDSKASPEKLLKSDYADVIKTMRILSLYDKTFAEDIKFQAKTGKSHNGKVEIEFVNTDKIIDIEKVKSAIRIQNFKSVGPLNWMSYDEAEKYVRSKNVKTAQEFFRRHEAGEFDPDLPFSVNTIYKDEGFKSWGQFLGTGSIQHSKRKNLYWSFKEARKFVHKLNLKSQSEWSKYCSSGKKPIEVPSHPHLVYAKEWISMGNWLGTGTVAPQNQEFDFEASIKWCQSIVKKFKIVSKKGQTKSLRSQFIEIIKKNKIKKPDNVTTNPGYNFKDHPKYQGEGPFFGWSTRTLLKKWKFKKARKFVRKLNIKTKTNWLLYTQNKLKGFKAKPLGIPSSPNTVYKKEWKGWGDWLGTFNKKGALKGNKNAIGG